MINHSRTSLCEHKLASFCQMEVKNAAVYG